MLTVSLGVELPGERPSSRKLMENDMGSNGPLTRNVWSSSSSIVPLKLLSALIVSSCGAGKLIPSSPNGLTTLTVPLTDPSSSIMFSLRVFD